MSGEAAREWGDGWARLGRRALTHAKRAQCEREARKAYELARVMEDDGA